MDLIQEAFQRLYPEKKFSYLSQLEYNRRLDQFNANISLRSSSLKVNLNLQWKDIDDEIKIGLIQHLLMRLFRHKKDTTNLELYHNFIKNVHSLAPKRESEPFLEDSFHRINRQFFSDSLEKPNLCWGKASFRKLAHYNFHNDTVTVSSLFQEAEKNMVDYLIYHELLHKYLKFHYRNGRSSYHNKEFRDAEKRFPQQEQLERDIRGYINSKKHLSKIVKVKTGLLRFFSDN